MNQKKSSRSVTFVDCQRCGTCCSEPVVPVTVSDVRRVSDFLEKPARKLVRFLSTTEIDYDPDADLWINFRYGKRIMTLRKVLDRCTFLSDNKCTIYPVRPLTCRTFPHDVTLKSLNSKTIDTFKLLSIVNCKATPSSQDLLPQIIKDSKREYREDRQFHKIVNKWNRLGLPGGTLDFLKFAGLE